jgi:GrpB-like predicted nucleotidyltransferase (UPF0157 family)
MKNAMKVMECDWDWGQAFEKEKKNIRMILGSHAVAIEHVGSTAIPQQDAKSVIAILIGVVPFRGFDFYQSMFSLKEYSYMQIDMNDRYLFKKYENGIWTHNLHILPYDDDFYLRNEFLLRDYLRDHPELVFEYGKVEKCFNKRNGCNIAKFTRSKIGFIQKIIDAARREKGLSLQHV